MSVHLLHLPDELLIITFSYLNGADKVSLSKTCTKLHELLMDKKLTRSLNFSACFSMSITDVKSYLTPKICRENVMELDLTSCYWVLSSDILKVAKKLTNLHALYVADTQLIWSHFVQILKSVQQLRRVSLTWSWSYQTDRGDRHISYEANETHPFAKLEFWLLHIVELDQQSHDALQYWLKCCVQLQELWVFGNELIVLDSLIPKTWTLCKMLQFPVQSGGFISSYCPPNVIHPDLNVWRCLFLQQPALGSNQLNRSKIDASPHIYEHHKVVVITPRLCEMDVFLFKNLKKLHIKRFHEVMDWVTLWESNTCLEELNLNVCETNITDTAVQPQMRMLALPLCIFRDCKETEAFNNVVRIIVETFPNIEVFELTKHTHCKYNPKSAAYESSFILFSKWKRLRRLKLSGIGCFFTGKPLIQICKMCDQLENLSLQDLGMSGKCGYLHSLCQALPFCRNLKEFRFVQRNVLQPDQLFVALQRCPLLERVVVVIEREGKLHSPASIVDLVVKSPRLIFLFVLLESLTNVAAKKMTNFISEQCKNQRPALIATVVAQIDKVQNVIEHTPCIHKHEMMQDVSQVCVRPGIGRRYLSHI